jgi:hypothetical protein
MISFGVSLPAVGLALWNQARLDRLPAEYGPFESRAERAS